MMNGVNHGRPNTMAALSKRWSYQTRVALSALHAMAGINWCPRPA
jgi:hypothetical protein